MALVELSYHYPVFISFHICKHRSSALEFQVRRTSEMTPDKPFSSNILWSPGLPRKLWRDEFSTFFSKIEHSYSLLEKALYVQKRKRKDVHVFANNSTYHRPCSGLCLNKRLIMWTDSGLKWSPRSQLVAVVFVLLVFCVILKDLFKLCECHFPLLQMRDQN